MESKIRHSKFPTEFLEDFTSTRARLFIAKKQPRGDARLRGGNLINFQGRMKAM